MSMLADGPSKVRWSADVFLQRLPRPWQGFGSSELRTIRLHTGVQLRYRLNRGDLQGIREVWLDDVYRFPGYLGPVRTIVDLGANIGLTSVYLFSRHDGQRLVAVEPVPSNVALVRQNLDLNGIAGDVIEAVVGRSDGVSFFEDAVASNLGRIADQGRQVNAVSMQTILDRLDGRDIDLLKIDIEGAEEELFSGDRAWLDSVRAMIIEFHPSIVDYEAIVAILEAEGFRHIPNASVYSISASAFVREGVPMTRSELPIQPAPSPSL